VNGPTIFGPCGRFMIRPEWHEGQTVAFVLFDAEGKAGGGLSVKVGRFQWATDAFARAAWMLGPNADDDTFGKTMDGIRFRDA
jgi:hypothetical protein